MSKGVPVVVAPSVPARGRGLVAMSSHASTGLGAGAMQGGSGGGHQRTSVGGQVAGQGGGVDGGSHASGEDLKAQNDALKKKLADFVAVTDGLKHKFEAVQEHNARLQQQVAESCKKPAAAASHPRYLFLCTCLCVSSCVDGIV